VPLQRARRRGTVALCAAFGTEALCAARPTRRVARLCVEALRVRYREAAELVPQGALGHLAVIRTK
jgi:hypothetical protein